MKVRALIIPLCCFWSICARAQLTGEFYLEKNTFAPGEPVYLDFKLLNVGPKPIQIFLSNSEQPFCSGLSITVANESSPASSCPSSGNNTCINNGSLKSATPLLPGQANFQRVLLNLNNEISAPGSYRVEATHIGVPNRTVKNVQSKLFFGVDGHVPAFSAIQLQPWVDRLQSRQPESRLEAARTLASLAPISLQETLLGFANNAEFRAYAPLAFHRLNTPQSIPALGNLMQMSTAGIAEHMEAARYIAQTGDQKWYPLLLEAALNNARMIEYPTYAAELGGEKMLPVLVILERRPDARQQAILAIGSTGSRSAIPILLRFLKSDKVEIRDDANYSLRLLTHRTARLDSVGPDQKDDYFKWSKWWHREGANASIYKRHRVRGDGSSAVTATANQLDSSDQLYGVVCPGSSARAFQTLPGWWRCT